MVGVQDKGVSEQRKEEVRVMYEYVGILLVCLPTKPTNKAVGART